MSTRASPSRQLAAHRRIEISLIKTEYIGGMTKLPEAAELFQTLLPAEPRKTKD